MEPRDINYAALLAYLENALAPDEMQAFQERLAADAAFADALRRLCEQETDLFALGSALQAVAPTVAIRDEVMQRVAMQSRVHAPRIEDELLALGDALREATPKVAVRETVMARLPHETQASGAAPLEDELRAVGAELRGRAPRVTVTEQVLAGAAPDRTASLIAHKQRKALRRRRASLSWGAIAAAAACLVAGLAVLMLQLARPAVISSLDVARRESAGEHPARTEVVVPIAEQKEGEALRFQQTPATEAILLLSDVKRPAAATEEKDDAPGDAQDARLELALEDILAARREALTGKSEALALLARWGALDPDEVRRLLDEGLLSAAELAGLSRFLPEQEAIELLQAAIALNPEDAALRFALARQLMDDPVRHGEALEQLAVLKDLAPENSMPYYMDAHILMAQGDYAGALQMLEYAASFGAAAAFALEAAQYHGAALLAAGLPYDAAQMLAAFNAGGNEYAAVTRLSYDLLSYGAFFEDMGDYDAALAVYKGVHRLGVQLGQGALFSNEQLAGLDAQIAALEAINALSQVANDPAMYPFLDDAYALFVQGLNRFFDNTNLIETLLQDSDMGAVIRAVRHIMRVGDLR